MMQLQHPQYAYSFVVAIAMLLAMFYYRRWWHIAKAKLGQVRHFAYLNEAFHFKRAPGNIITLIIAAILLVVALLHPRRPDTNTSNNTMQGYEVAIVLDVSNSMMATDIPPSRLQQATLLMKMLIDTLQGSRVSFTAFAGEAFLQMPLTTDLQGARSIIEGVSPNMVPVQGTSVAKALQQASESFDETPANYKAVVMLTDGETHDEESLEAANALKNKGVMLIAVGIGSSNGATLKDSYGFPMRDPETNETVVSKLDEELLMELAAITSGEYHNFNNANETLEKVLGDLNNMDKKPLANYAGINYYSYASWFIGAALALLLFPSWRPFFAGVKKTAATMLLLAFLGTANAQQKDLNEARQLYQQGEINKAEALFNKVLQAEPNNPLAKYYLGAIAFRNENYAEAAEFFDQSRTYLQQNQKKANAANNQGIALAKSGKNEEAVAVLKEALKKNPYDKEIQHNLNVALKQQQRDQQQQQPPPPPPPKKQKQNEDKLKALEEEEKKTREKQMEQKAKGSNQKNW